MRVKRYPPNDERTRIGVCEDGTEILMPTLLSSRVFSSMDRNNQGVLRKRAKKFDKAVIAWLRYPPKKRKLILKKLDSLGEFNPRDEKMWRIIRDILALAHLIEPVHADQFEGLEEYTSGDE